MDYGSIHTLLRQSGWTEIGRDDTHISYTHKDRKVTVSIKITGDAVPAALRGIERQTGIKLPRF
jgi:predicted RNA binding protein YcfA (HicA-like mRNA interferase family)|tara:strand:+ start:2319 stop:2510 length:192 start_codon:yes stop_codon:yes gene_type:complete